MKKRADPASNCQLINSYCQINVKAIVHTDHQYLHQYSSISRHKENLLAEKFEIIRLQRQNSEEFSVKIKYLRSRKCGILVQYYTCTYITAIQYTYTPCI